MSVTDFKLQLLENKWTPIEANFKPPEGWDGPHLLGPDEVADLCRRNNLPPPEPSTQWQIIFNYTAASAWHPEDPHGDGGVQAAIFFPTLDHLLNTSTREVVRMMACSIAGRAAHEALEWTTMEGKLVVNPHGTDADVAQVDAYIRGYLGNGATGIEPPQGVY